MRPGISAGNITKDTLGARGYFFREIEREIRGGAASARREVFFTSRRFAPR